MTVTANPNRRCQENDSFDKFSVDGLGHSDVATPKFDAGEMVSVLQLGDPPAPLGVTGARCINSTAIQSPYLTCENYT